MRTRASVGGHPVHMMIVHFPMAFLIGAFLFDVAAVLGAPVPWAIGGYLLVAGLFAGMIAALPGSCRLHDDGTASRRTTGRYRHSSRNPEYELADRIRRRLVPAR
jgi:uncharacterized membrane protein